MNNPQNNWIIGSIVSKFVSDMAYLCSFLFLIIKFNDVGELPAWIIDNNAAIGGVGDVTTEQTDLVKTFRNLFLLVCLLIWIVLLGEMVINAYIRYTSGKDAVKLGATFNVFFSGLPFICNIIV